MVINHSHILIKQTIKQLIFLKIILILFNHLNFKINQIIIT